MDNKVLIIEDDRLNMKLITDLLQMEGYRTFQNSDGEGVEEFVRVYQPDLIMADIRLPGRSGLEITRVLKSNPETKHIPIILTTAFTHYGTRAVCMESGCDGYLAKPYAINDLYEIIDPFMPKHQMVVGL